MERTKLEELCALIDVARSEAQTIAEYMRYPKSGISAQTYDEIISDELNHALKALFLFSKESGIKIASDGIGELLGEDLFTEE